jgi:FkbH-like protein
MQAAFATEEEFLRSLDMRATIEGFTPFNTPRVAQLTQRSNQFNLRTVRYAEDDIRRLAASPRHVPLTFALEDRLGEHGLIAVVVLADDGRELFIDTWLMSCRVLRRGMEAFVLNILVERARELGYDTLVGEYLPTAKNGMVRDHYAALGFVAASGRWRLDLATFTARQTFITEKVPADAP